MRTSIQKVTILETNAAGETTAVVSYDPGASKKEKKGSRWLAIPQTIALQGLDAGARTFEAMRTYHHESNRKRRNGWLMDLGPNLFKAAYKGRKRIKVQRWLLAK